MDTPLLGRPVLALDASAPMLAAVAGRAPDALRVRADLAALPVRRAGLAGAWASKSYQHVPHEDLPLALAHLHDALVVDAPVRLSLFAGTGTLVSTSSDSLSGRRFSLWAPDHLADVVAGAGFAVEDVTVTGEEEQITVAATRRRSLPDYVGPGLRLLVCGLNPSLYAADAGVNYARPGNRFWPAALAAGVVTRDRDPWHAVRHDRVGLTDLVKRATTAAGELAPAEYADGVARLERLCAWLRPAAVCLVGLAGWRVAVDRRAVAGIQPRALAGVPVYVMPSTSGLNAHARLDDLTGHLRQALALGAAVS
jgi:TDG/mug DNA glycosylase family protein